MDFTGQVSTLSNRSGATGQLVYEATVCPELPRQAWLAGVAGVNVRAFSGSSVEHFSNGLVDGCWDGPFDEYNFDKSANFFGTGVVIDEDRVVFVAPTHTLEALYMLEGEDGVVVSNSLAFLLEFTGAALPGSVSYGKRFASIVLGIDRYARAICHIDGKRLLRIGYSNVIWRDGLLTFTDKQESPRFRHYAEYHAYLQTVLAGVFDNGKSGYRSTPLQPMTTCSSGYDSAACAALAASLGCVEALTLKRSQGNKDDSGLNVARALDLDVYEYERSARSDRTDNPEAEFLATGMGGEDYVYHVFEDRLCNRILLTGFHGDKVWDINAQPGATISRGDISGSSMTEWRLRTGFVLLPVPFIAVTRHHDIHRIGLSDEMSGYRLDNGQYDRPVPRRIAEDMGVPRVYFGQSKKAVSMLFCHSLKFMTKASLQDMDEFREKTFGRAGTLYLRMRQAVYECRMNALRRLLGLTEKIFNTRLPMLWRLQPLWRRHGDTIRKKLSILVVGDYRVFEHGSPLNSDLPFLWAVEKVRRRYRLLDP